MTLHYSEPLTRTRTDKRAEPLCRRYIIRSLDDFRWYILLCMIYYARILLGTYICTHRNRL